MLLFDRRIRTIHFPGSACLGNGIERYQSSKPLATTDDVCSFQSPRYIVTGHVWLTNGEELFVTPAALQALAAQLVAPPAAVAAAQI
ncbi:hypothetical protein [Burkholderia vietnamiensis]|uniref:hypothetical protein n=1 Tax=Burkholderia vietnamiensis TaxID=60552 RepID=UPI002653A975|nr:hypothetical protein [Burkholderia vietnamiensis]MDN8035775.1 hypothetical protein [Burkholderia vietnamiensis]